MTLAPELVEDLVRQLYRLGLVQRELGRHAMAELGSQGFVALGIVRVHEPLRPSEVARRLAVDLSVASRQLAALQSAGYIEREPDPSDGRAHRVRTTADGQRVLQDSHRRMVDACARALDGWGTHDVQRLAAGLERLREDFAAALIQEPTTA